jgi:hypothetical protein
MFRVHTESFLMYGIGSLLDKFVGKQIQANNGYGSDKEGFLIVVHKVVCLHCSNP